MRLLEDAKSAIVGCFYVMITNWFKGLDIRAFFSTYAQSVLSILCLGEVAFSLHLMY